MHWANLFDRVKESTSDSDEIIIISGYASASIIDEVAKLGKKTTVVYGMYPRDGVTQLLHDKLCSLNATYPNLTIMIAYYYHVHTKCYLFFNDSEKHIYFGSANASEPGLNCSEYSEVLVELRDKKYISELVDYSIKIINDSVICSDPRVIPSKSNKKGKGSSRRLLLTKPLSSYSVDMSLYMEGSSPKKVQPRAGINWGCQSGHSKKVGVGTYAEAYIPVLARHIDGFPAIFPPNQSIRSSSSGKSTRQNDPFDVIWDDGELMKMIFSGEGVKRPTKGKRPSGGVYRVYPKQLTSADGGGAVLGEYLRKRLQSSGVTIGNHDVIKYSHLKKYGRDFIQFTYIHPGYYEADFSI